VFSRSHVLAGCAALLLVACGREPAPTTVNAPPFDETAFRTQIQEFDRDVVAQLRRLPEEQLSPDERAALTRGTTLGSPATREQIEALAKRIGKPLPRSYRAFLATTDGMMFEGALNQVTMRRAADVIRLSESDYPPLGIWLAMPDAAVPLDPTAGGPLPGLALARAWAISSNEDGDIYLIFPELASPDGEWPVWFFGPKNPGAYGYASFGAMFERERRAALRTIAQRRRP